LRLECACKAIANRHLASAARRVFETGFSAQKIAGAIARNVMQSVKN
jgi:hypothetical protein